MSTFTGPSSISGESGQSILLFSADNPCNTTITTQAGISVYKVSTSKDSRQQLVTRVYARRNGRTVILAAWKWRDVLPDVLTLGNNPPIPATRWLRKTMMSVLPFSHFVAAFTDGHQRRLVWKGHGPDLPFKLYLSGKTSSAPVAVFHHATPDVPEKARIITSLPCLRKASSQKGLKPHPATLILDACISDSETMDQVMISFLLLEKTRRITLNTSLDMIDILGTCDGRSKGT